MKFDYEVIIIGAGPAGLSAALVLGRCLRKVLICDSGSYRNRHSSHINGYLTRDGISPKRFRKIANSELDKYKTLKLIQGEITDLKSLNQGFAATLNGSQSITARKILLATGRKDEWPDLPNAKTFYGKSIFHCPYCDAWEWQDKQLIAYSQGDEGADYAMILKQWSNSIVYCTNGESSISSKKMQQLKACNIAVNIDKIIFLEGTRSLLKKIHFKNQSISCDALFFNHASFQHSLLAKKMGCELDEKNAVIVEKLENTKNPGLYVAGDACQEILQVSVSAGQGVEAAIYINASLSKEDLFPD